MARKRYRIKRYGNREYIVQRRGRLPFWWTATDPQGFAEKFYTREKALKYVKECKEHDEQQRASWHVVWEED